MTTRSSPDPRDPRAQPAGRARPTSSSDPSGRPVRPEPVGREPARREPGAGRTRVPNRPEPSRGRSPGERRHPDGQARQDSRPGEDARELIGVATSVGGRRTSDRQTSHRRAGDRQTSAPASPARRARPSRRRPAVSQRGRRTRRDSGTRVNTRRRTKAALIIVLSLLTLALGKLVTIQTVDARGLTASRLQESQRVLTLHAQRGSIDDRNGAPLAFSVEGRLIAAHPSWFENDDQRARVADILVAELGPAVDRSDLMTKLRSTSKYVYLAHGLMPAVADAVMARISPVLTDRKAADAVQAKLVNAVVTDREDIRTAPAGAFAASIVGTAGRNGHGLAGIESKFDALLTGNDGTRTLQIDRKGIAIPNTVSAAVPAVDGSSIRLTLDQDLQYSVQQYLAAQVSASQAKGGCAVIKGISDGQIYAMSCVEPGKTAAQIGNPAISIPFEPGSVNKVVTFAAALDRGLITPSTVLSVDGQISIGGRQIHDAWPHSTIDMTATGILGKSSNVGTLMLAQQLGPTAFAQELTKYRLGSKTGIELPGESAGSYPPQSQWSATSFGNLPIGQGVSMTLLQLVDMYQAIGNKGVMVSPSIIDGTTSNGVFTPSAVRWTTQVMKPTTAATLLGMLRGTVQGGDYDHRGTGPKAAITGYQVAGKTGTAQQIDPVTHAYSDSITTATFAGIVPADNPKYAIAIMIDAPVNGSEGGGSAAPLFHQIASYALRAADVPPSATTAPIYDLYVNRAG